MKNFLQYFNWMDYFRYFIYDDEINYTIFGFFFLSHITFSSDVSGDS